MLRRLTPHLIPVALLLVACGDGNVQQLPDSLTATRDATEAECTDGGIVFLTGLDDDGDGALGESEVDDAQIVCSPEDGMPGDDGSPGRDALIRVTEEPAGTNCEFGGQRFDSGVDTDEDGQLDDEEVEMTTYVCDAAPGEDGANYLVRTSTATRPECDDGPAVVLDSGFDDDRDGALGDDEIEDTEVICLGREGLSFLIDVSPEPAGTNCSAGGQRVRRGFDSNRSGSLEPTEVEEVQFLCTPVATLVRTSTIGPGAECEVGGLRLQSGLDNNANGILEDVEVNATRFLCDGTDGFAALVATSSVGPGSDCPNGGFRVETGLDLNRDGVLNPDEVSSTSFACDGDPGQDGRGNSAVRLTVEPAGVNCENGGTRVETGPDTDGDGQLADQEVTETRYVCNGQANATLVAVETIEPGGVCLNGGQRILEGLDGNGDGVLDPSEVDSTTVVCSSVNTLPITISTGTVPDALRSGDYEAEVEALGGIGSGYSWSISGGALPPGIGLDGTGNPAVLSGTPTSTGTFSFDLVVTDFVGSVAVASFSIDVDAPPCEAGVAGVVGEQSTPFASPISISTSSYQIAADTSTSGYVYILGTNSLVRIAKDGSSSDDVESLAGLAAADLGYEIEIDGNDIYVVSDATSGSTNRVQRISDDGGATWSVQDMMDFSGLASTPADLRGLEIDGSTMYVISHTTDCVIYSADISGTLPAPATEVVTLTGYDNCTGLDVDNQYFYTTFGDRPQSDSEDGIIRIDRNQFGVTEVFFGFSIFDLDDFGYNAAEIQDTDNDGVADVIFASGSSGARRYVCDPGGTGPFFSAAYAESIDGDNGLTYEPTEGVIWVYDEGGTPDDEIVELR